MKWSLILATLAILMVPAYARVHTLDGNWPVTITNSQQFNGSHCLTIGQGAELDNTYIGDFRVIGNNFNAFLEIDGSGQEPATLLFIARAKNGVITKNGAFEYIQGGYLYDSGTATFGKKGDC